MSPQIIPTAEPFFFPGSKTGCLLIHGFTGTPKEMRWMGEYLHQQGFTALGMRLTGHATRQQDMARTHWKDWLVSVEDGWHLLKENCDQIFVIGLSMGGVLSLLFASQFPVDGVIAMSTPYALPPDPRLRIIKFLSIFKPYLEKGGSDAHNREALQEHISYPANPTRSIGELLDLLTEMRAALPAVQAPALIVHSRNDQYVPPANGDKIFAQLGSPDKQMLWVENSGHVIPREPERERVFKAAANFIRQHPPQTHES